MKFRLTIILWLAAPFLLWRVLRSIPLNDVPATFHGFHASAVLALIVLNAVILVLFNSRWWLILRKQGYSVSYLALVAYRLAAFSVTYFTPGPQFGGEPLQVYLLQRRQGVPGRTALASVSLEKLVELLANFTFLCAGAGVIFLSGVVGEQERVQAVLLAGGLLALPLAYLLALWNGFAPLSWFARRLAQYLPNSTFMEKAGSAFQQAETLMANFCRRHPSTILFSYMLSLFTWILLGFEYWLVVRFFGLRLDILQVMIIMTAARIAFLLPIPAGLGALEAGQVMAMRAFGFDPAFGVSISLLIRLRDITLGLIGMALAAALTRRLTAKGLRTEAGD